MIISQYLLYFSLKMKVNFFENWLLKKDKMVLSMPEEGFSFFEIQTPLKIFYPPQTERSP